MKKDQSGGRRRNVIAVTWEQHRRTQGLSAGLQMPLFELGYRGGRIARYFVLAWQTFVLLLRKRPHALLVQNPSLVLAAMALALRPLLRYKLVVDAHNEAVQPFIHDHWPIPQLARMLLRGADVTIVTNQKLAHVVEASGGRPFVLPDPLPEVPIVASAARTLEADLDIMVISTYAPDEPIEAIFAAAAQLGPTFRFHVTGNDRKLAPEARARLPVNVRLTGFLPEEEYWALMDKCHVVLDLTLMPDCLVCGAYEALSMCRPMVLSDNPATRELFGRVSVLSAASAAAICHALREMRHRYGDLSRAAPQERALFEANWARDSTVLADKLSS